jgi:uncharacterized protein YdhG (YjbR/CyaY superfamily)
MMTKPANVDAYMMTKPANVDAYIASFPEDIQVLLEQFRETIKAAAPGAEELISYGIPAFRYQKAMLVWFAAHTNHIGFYPRGSGIEEFKEELKGYKVSKGTIQFPLDQPLPIDIITKIVKFRVEQNLMKVKKK